MADPQTPQDLQDQIEQKLDDLQKDMSDKLNSFADHLNSLSKWSWLGGPLTGGALAYVKHQFEEQVPKIWDAFTTGVKAVWDAIMDVLGDPYTLNANAAACNSAVSALRAHDTAIPTDLGALGTSWSGGAFTAYSTVANEQDAARKGVATALDTTSALFAEAAQKLLDLWVAQLINLGHTCTAVLNAVADATNASNIVTFDAGPIIKLCTALADGVLDAEASFVTYMSDQGTSTSNSWRSLNSGVEGLNGLQWPPAEARLADIYENSGNWKPS